MSIDVFILSTERERYDIFKSRIPALLSIEDGGAYAILSPCFERLAEKIGRRIDLYGDAFFQGPELNELIATLRDMRRELETFPESSEDNTAVQITMLPEIEKPQNYRNETLALLNRLYAAASKAEDAGRVLAFIGD